MWQTIRRTLHLVVALAVAIATFLLASGSATPAIADGGDAPGAPAAFRALTVGWDHACAILPNASVRCWGSNDFGQIAFGLQTNLGDAPGEMVVLGSVNLGTGRTASALSAGWGHNCAILDNATLKCWGANDVGELGIGDTVNHGIGGMGDLLPTVSLGSGRSPVSIAAGARHTCAVLDNGSVKCWGFNGFGQLGQGDTAIHGDGPNEMGDDLPAVPLGTGRTAIAVAAGDDHSCALLDNGSVKCWGRGLNGRLGQGDNTTNRGDAPGELGDSLPAIALGTGRTATAITAGADHTCALLDNGTVKCWGPNASGQLGLGDVAARGGSAGTVGDGLPAVALGTGRTATALSAGEQYTCARLDNDRLKCWGRNNVGQLGQGDTANRGDDPNEMGDNLGPISLGSGRTVSAVATGVDDTCATLDDGTRKCWGRNQHGQLGQGDTTNRGDGPNELGDRLLAIWLTPPGLVGTVTDSVTGQPVPGAFIAILRTSDFGLATTLVAGANGFYRAPVPAGSYFFYMIDPAGGHTAGFSGPPTTYTVTNAIDLTANSTMVPTRGAISGTVTDAGDGLGLGGVWALAVGVNGGMAGSTLTASNGSYTIANLPVGAYKVTFVDGPGHRPQEWWNNGADFGVATVVNVAAGQTTANINGTPSFP